MANPPSLSEIKHRLEIDEEGYPVFSGLRIHDEEVLKDIFSHLQRSQAEFPRSKLITCLEGRNWAWIDAFDAPLVAQAIELTAEDFVELKFLGGLSETVTLADFEIDEWHRFHVVVGAAAIPAVLSRKAQAALLNVLSTRATLPSFRGFRAPLESAPAEASFWAGVYAQKQDGWELGGAHPFLSSRTWKGFEEAKILVPGAGRGHDAALIAECLPLATVQALDIAPQAQADALTKYSAKKNLSYLCEDVFGFFKAQEDASWDLVFEHTFFCAIDPLMRTEYVREVTRILRPSGSWRGIFFLLEHAGGPPFATTQWELRELTRKHFDIRMWDRIEKSPSGRTHKELWAEFSKRSI